MRDVRVLRWFYEWCNIRNIPIEDRLRAGKIFVKAEITSFCRYLRSLRSQIVVGSIGNHESRDKPIPILSPQTFNSYIQVVENFLLWAAYEFIPLTTPENILRETVRSAQAHIKRAFRSNLKDGRGGATRCGLTPEEVDEIRSYLKPGAKLNPFKKCVQFRNYLIFELMLATGLRRGELLKIKLKHLPIGSKTTLSVVRDPDDIDDPRRNEPQVKTRMREISLHKKLRVDLWKYIRQHRKSNDKNSYLFTSHRTGLPLNAGAVNWIFSLLTKKRIPQLRRRLSPHVVRHTFNERLVELAESLKWPEQQIKDLQRYLNGWSERSKMPRTYTRRIVEAQAMEIAEKYQDTLYVF